MANDDIEKERALNQQILAGLSTKEQELQDITNPQRPIRAAALAALSGENPFAAASQAIQQRTDVTPEQIAHKLFERAEETGLPLRAPGQTEFPLERPAGAIIGPLTDVGNLQSLAAGTIAPRYKQITSALQQGKEVPRDKIIGAIRQAQRTEPETVLSTAPKTGLQDINIPLTAEEYQSKIARLQAERSLQKAKEALEPEKKPRSYFDFARQMKNK